MTRTIIVSGLLLFALGCSQEQQAQDTPAPAEAKAGAEAPAAVLERTPAAEGARVFFISPTDGATVSSPLRIEFGIEGMAIVRAGDKQPDSGHHHLLIDTHLPDLGSPVPTDAQHIHFGDGSTSTEIALEPGQHSLRLLLGDYRHVPHDPAVVSDAITITVE